jgi:hypothetical protein
MQGQKKAGEGDSFSLVLEDIKLKPATFQGPDVHEAMRLAGVKDLKLDPSKPRGKPEKRVTLLCCCGVSGCGIGPMTKTEEEQ